MDAAREKAAQFLNKPYKSNGTRRTPRQVPQLVLANNSSELYAFNDEANGGYVVVSGDERMPDVLAYSYNGFYDADNLPCNMKALMEEYAAQVAYLREHPGAKVAKRAATERQNIAPLLTCWFNQGSPYNNKCPEVDGKHCLTGCVATAMAQIMYYYQWPKQTTDVIPGYTTRTRKIEMSAIPVTTIDWDNMLEQYFSWEYYSNEQIDAISTLMLLCGTSVLMDYEPTESGTGTLFSARAFCNYFDYDDMIEEVYRKNYKSEGWEQIVYDEINARRPVLYSGSSRESGHAFVLDGYENGYFHVRWGWGKSESWVLMTDDEGWMGYTIGYSAVIGIQPKAPGSPSRYAVFDNGEMTMYYDNQKANRSGTVIPHMEDWANYKEEVTECVIDPSFANIHLKSFNKFFYGWSKLESIEGIENINTSMATDMSYMFSGCSCLTNLDLSGFETGNVTNMGYMFHNCKSLTSLDLSGFKTDNVTNMINMFAGCSSLTSLDVSGFKTDNVTNMKSMFTTCSNLTSLDVSGFKTDNVTNMKSMISGCSGLTSLDVSGFKTDNVTDMSYMFSRCSGLTSLDVSGFKTDNVTNMEGMFTGCSSLTSLDVSGFKTDNVNDMSFMFSGCPSLASLDVSGFKTDNVTNMNRMFMNCSSLTSLDASGFKTDNVIDMGNMFFGCKGLYTIYVSERWNMSNVTSSDYMFSNCTNIVGGAGTTFDAQHTDGDYAHIDEGTENPGYFTYKAPQTGIRNILSDKQNAKWYTLDGKQTINPRKGLNIIRISNGKTKKVLLK